MLSRHGWTVRGATTLLCGALAIALGGRPARAQDVVYGPWLQDVHTDGIAVLWRADELEASAPQVVVLAPAGGELLRVDAQSTTVNGQILYTARLSGLSTATCYTYAVHSGGTQLDGLRFCTARAAGQSGFRFYVAGDSRSNPSVWGQIAQRILADVEQDPARHQTVLLHTGDLVGDGSIAANWDELWPPARDLLARLPMYTAYGNHEDRNTATSDAFVYGYFESPAAASGSTDEKWYALNYGSLHVPSLAIYDDAGYASGAQHDWLSADLAGPAQAASVRWRIGLIHFAPWSLGNHLESEADGLRAALHPLYRDHGVPLVFGGHNHLYARYEPVEGVAYVTSGGGGASLHTGTYTAWSGAVLAHAAAVYQFVAVDVEDDALTLRAIDSQGQLYDLASYGGVVGNRPPAAVAGPDQRVQVGDTVVLDGRASVDPEAAALGYAWTQRAGPGVTLDDATRDRPSFVASQAGRVQFHLRVSDGVYTSPPDLVQIEVVDQVVQLAPVADTFVDSAAPDTANGSASVLQVDASPSTARAFLRFVVPAEVAQVQQATLRMYCVNSGAAPAVDTSSDVLWSEASTTWNQAPALAGGSHGSLSAPLASAWSEADVSSAVVGAGPVTLALLPTGDDGADFESREAAHPPQLVLGVRLLPVDAGAGEGGADAAAVSDGAGLDGAPDAGMPADAGAPDPGPPPDASSGDLGPTDRTTLDGAGPPDGAPVDGVAPESAVPDAEPGEAPRDQGSADLSSVVPADGGGHTSSPDRGVASTQVASGCTCRSTPGLPGWGPLAVLLLAGGGVRRRLRRR